MPALLAGTHDLEDPRPMGKLIRYAVLAVAVLMVAPLARGQAARDATAMMNDAWITAQVHAKFFMDPDIKSLDINVDTTAGVVTLGGEVHSAAEHTRAVAKAKGTDGVKRVVDKLVVTPRGHTTAETLKDKAVAALPRQEQVKAQAKTAAVRVGKEISDTWITTQVQAMYFLDREVKAMKVGVSTSGGIVTLSGTVPSEAIRRKAIADARSVDGVKQVLDKLSVRK
jgi:hyperosmotically inducible periplasmic protein